MAKLFAPLITSIPAFEIGNKIIIPFETGLATGLSQIDSFSLLIKTVSTNIEKCVLTSNVIENEAVIFDISTLDIFTIGQYYKMQLACVEKDTGDLGYYSIAAVAKCTAKPILMVEYDNNKFIGIYKNEKDPSERVYSYGFNLYKNGVLYNSIQEQLHNAKNDVDTKESYDYWDLGVYLFPDSYTIEYKVVTVNGLETFITQDFDVSLLEGELSFDGVLSATNNPDEGYIQLALLAKNGQTNFGGSYILNRADSNDNFSTWHKVFSFDIDDITGSRVNIWKDFSVEAGTDYLYSLQTKLEGTVSKFLYNQEGKVKAVFEDMFLADKNHQLKIRFNPKVASFKATLQESKTDTIGSKYPYFYRNGQVGYKEFSISGLISLLMDENRFFDPEMYPESSQKGEPLTEVEDSGGPTALSAVNFKNEKDFKLAVLDWLNNGEPKLFRSAAEGNYIIRLMNTTLSPTDSLGRMLHTFTTNAYEIDDYSFKNVQNYGFLRERLTQHEKFYSAYLNKEVNKDLILINEDFNMITLSNAYSVKINTIGESILDIAGVGTVVVPPFGEYYVRQSVSSITFLGGPDSAITPKIQLMNTHIEFLYKDLEIERKENYKEFYTSIEYNNKGNLSRIYPGVTDYLSKLNSPQEVYWMKVSRQNKDNIVKILRDKDGNYTDTTGNIITLDENIFYTIASDNFDGSLDNYILYGNTMISGKAWTSAEFESFYINSDDKEIVYPKDRNSSNYFEFELYNLGKLNLLKAGHGVTIEIIYKGRMS